MKKKNNQYKLSFIVSAAFLLMVVLTVTGMRAPERLSADKTVAATKPIVIMELFTSQGCSSCPPADALLSEYATGSDKQIIPLSFHVDYWNRLGWTDPFSNNAYSVRQQWYSEHLPKGSVYTPQMIVNGKGEAVGNNRNAVKALVEKAFTVNSGQTISIDHVMIEKGKLDFTYIASQVNNNEVLNVALIQKTVTTNIKAGENSGVTITNRNIVRSFATQKLVASGDVMVALPSSFKAPEYALVVYVQNTNDLSITTALMKEF